MRTALLILGSLTALLTACSGPGPFTANPGNRTLTYEPGAPNFDMEAVATLREGVPGLDLYLNVPYTSLVFVRADSGYQAHYEVLARVQDARGRRILREAVWTDTLVVDDYEATQQFVMLTRTRRLPLPPGRYRIELRMEDAQTGAAAVRRQDVEVFAAQGPPRLSAIRLEARRGRAPFQPLAALHLPAGYDSLRATVELYDAAAGADVEMTLLRFENDTTVARPPYLFSPGGFTLEHRGIYYDGADTLQRTRRRLRDVDDQVTLVFSLPPLAPGSYRVAVTAQLTDADRSFLRHQRDFTVRGETFPRITALDEMIDALTYIARADELAHIRAAPTPAERRARFDAFWGSLIPNREAAAAAIERYYSRVEEANVRYTTHKPGWQTDRGMVYIILGPPSWIEDELTQRVWRYSLQADWPDYVFERVRPFDLESPFLNYILQRSPAYERVWSRAVDRWRAGRAL